MASQNTPPTIQLDETATQKFLAWVAAFAHADDDRFHRAQTLATRLGAHYRPDGLTEIAFWLPDVSESGQDSSSNEANPEQSTRDRTPETLYLEIFTPLTPIDFRALEQKVTFRCDRLPLHNQRDYFCGVYSGMQPGTREQAGSFYWVKSLNPQTQQWQIIGDVLAYSLPYGVFAPAELYDMDSLQKNRADLDYFQQGEPCEEGFVKVSTPRNILELHINTASPEGTVEGLTRIYQRIGDKIKANQPLTPAEENYIGYDALQPLPIEPLVEYWDTEKSCRPGFFRWDASTDMTADVVEVTLKKPDIENWGYDIVMAASSATNPALLGSLRPDELVDFIATLHNFPTGPIQMIYDIVYGHADNQALQLLSPPFLQGANMYGQDINHQNPTVRAILLEMQRRKIDTGADGIRVDGAQDFKFFNPQSGQVEYDDDYLLEMSNVLQDIGDNKRQMFRIFEDGRPWPQEGWEQSSTYKDVMKFQPEIYQWGPLIFAHNTPSLNKFWDIKWERMCEVIWEGSQWLTGCANHDTVRRGTQIPLDKDINWNLGKTLPEVLKNAYDNPATTLLVYAFSPGLPMDFLNSLMRSPWCFFRNTDDYYGLKVMSEEVGFLHWQIEPEMYERADVFPRIKQLGFTDFENLRQFMGWLNKTIADMGDDYDLERLAKLCQTFLEEQGTKTPEITVKGLHHLARIYMEDCHALCNVYHYEQFLDPQQTAFNLALRRYRQSRTWLMDDLKKPADCFDRISDGKKTIFYGVRTNQTVEGNGDEKVGKVAIAVHMGGEPITLNLGEILDLDLSQWRIAMTTPGLAIDDNPQALSTLTLKDMQGILLEPR